MKTRTIITDFMARTAMTLLIIMLQGATATIEGYTVSTVPSPAIDGTVEVSLDNATWYSSVNATDGQTVYFRFNPPSGYEIIYRSIETDKGKLVSYTDKQFTMPNDNVTLYVDFRYTGLGVIDSYTVTLSPGLGTGTPIIYHFDPETAAPNSSAAQNCHFYYVNYNTIGFRLDGNYFPSSFTPPDGTHISGWSNSGYITLSSQQTTFTTYYSDNPNDSYYSLSPTAYTIANSGYTDITCTLSSLFLGQVMSNGQYVQAEGIYFYMNGGTLTDGAGHNIPFLVDSGFHFGAGTRKNIGYDLQGEEFMMAVYIDPEDYDNEVPGIYTGYFIYDAIWELVNDEDVPGLSSSIALTLVIPEAHVTLADDTDNSSVIVNNQSVNVTLDGRTLYRDGNWNTLCLPFDVEIMGSNFDKTGVTLMELDTEAGNYDHPTGFDEGILYLNFKSAGTTIKAGKPYIIKWTKPSGYLNGPDISNPVFGGVTINSAAPTAVTSEDETVSFVGCYSPVTLSEGDHTKLYLGADNTLYYPSTAVTINSCRAYFQLNGITAGESTNGINAFTINFDDNGTSAIDIISEEMVNRQSSMVNRQWYDLSGRKLNAKPTAKGIYINNGKKIVIK